MAVGLRVGSNVWLLGRQDFVDAFFSTIAVRLESDQWGSRFPVLQKQLYGGHLEPEQVDEALKELRDITEELRELPPSDVVWDAEDLQRRPPWGDDISPEITDLSNYFVTMDGKVLLEVLEEGLAYAQRAEKDVSVEGGF